MSMLSRFPTTATAGIQYVGGTTAAITGSTATTTSVSLTALTGGLAAAPAANDVVIVYYGVSSTVDRTIGVETAGYTEVAELYANDTYDANLSVSYKLMGSTPDTQVTVSATGAIPDAGAVAVQVWRYVDAVLPLSVATTTATGTNSVLCNPPAITPTTPGAIIIAGGAGAHIAGVQTYSSSDLQNFITRGGPNSTNDVTVGMGSRAWTSGAFDPAAFTFSGASANTNSWAAVTLALRPENPQTGPFLIYQASAQNGATGNSLVINKPTGTRENDLLIACMNGSTNVTWIGDTGWTEVADQGTAPSTRVAYKIAGASEGASYTFTASSVSGTLSGTIATYRNAAYDAIGTIATGANPLVVGAVTATVDFSRILATVARDVGSITITGPATMQTIAIDNDATAPSRLVEEDINLSLSGSSGTRSFTVGNTVGVSGVLVSIKPAATYTPYAQYITRTTATAAAATSIAVNTSTCVPGNLLVLVVTYAFATLATDSLLTPSGWTLVSGTAPPGTAFYSPGMYVFYRIADGSEAASYTVSSTPGTTAGSYTAAMVTLAGINSSQIVAGATNSGSNTTSITATAVDARNNGILLYFGTQANDITAVTFTPPSGMTEAADIALSTASVDVTLEIAYQEGLSEGSTGNKTATASSSAGSDNYRALLVTIGAL